MRREKEKNLNFTTFGHENTKYLLGNSQYIMEIHNI